MRTLQQRFRFYRQVNAAPLAYYFARRKHAEGYEVPYFLVLWMGPIGRESVQTPVILTGLQGRLDEYISSSRGVK